jgi:uncharacterized membrane protein
MQQITNWIRERYQRVVGSIAFLPAIIALLFLGLAVVMVLFDFSEAGKNIKSSMHWLSLKDATTARSIVSAIVSGIISLSVFSFSMVMIILNQTASNMSNRILDKLIGNRFQQAVLGFYIGSIVYALFLLSTIRDTSAYINVPAISTYLLIVLTILDIFLFIYFLHYITQSVKYETIIRRIRRQTEDSMLKTCTAAQEETPQALSEGTMLHAQESGFMQRVHLDGLITYCTKNNLCVSLLYPFGTFLLQGTGYLLVSGSGIKDFNSGKNSLHHFIQFEQRHALEANYHYGFRQLTEVAVKALSPGINDPGTAVESLQAITSLLHLRMQHHPQCNFYDKEGHLRVVLCERTFIQVFQDALHPIWHYGYNDPMIQRAYCHLLIQLAALAKHPIIQRMLQTVEQQIKQNKSTADS